MKKLLIAFALILVSVSSSHAFETKGFIHPYGVVVDPATGYIYVSNINGPGEKKDGNGFISRLKPDGSMDVLRFIDGIQRLIELNAPKGMAIIGSFLYVTDIDALRVFDIGKAAPLFTVNFGDYPIQHFYDLAIGPDGALYVTDGPANTVYRIDVMSEHRVTPFIQDPGLGEPHGITWFSARQVFLVGGWKAGHVLAYDRTGMRATFPGIFLQAVEGIAADMVNRAYVASTAMNGVYRISPEGALFSFAIDIDTPLNIAFNAKTQDILVVSYRRGSVSSFPVK